MADARCHRRRAGEAGRRVSRHRHRVQGRARVLRGRRVLAAAGRRADRPDGVPGKLHADWRTRHAAGAPIGLGERPAMDAVLRTARTEPDRKADGTEVLSRGAPYPLTRCSFTKFDGPGAGSGVTLTNTTIEFSRMTPR